MSERGLRIDRSRAAWSHAGTAGGADAGPSGRGEVAS